MPAVDDCRSEAHRLTRLSVLAPLYVLNIPVSFAMRGSRGGDQRSQGGICFRTSHLLYRGVWTP